MNVRRAWRALAGPGKWETKSKDISTAKVTGIGRRRAAERQVGSQGIPRQVIGKRDLSYLEKSNQRLCETVLRMAHAHVRSSRVGGAIDRSLDAIFSFCCQHDAFLQRMED
jgi:hypothetical protein